MMMNSFAPDWRRKREAAPMPSAVALVEKATSDLLSEPDWAVNMDICDAVNSDLRQARDVIKTVKKRLVRKSSMVQFLALTLLETMVKNCGDYVHLQVVECQVLDEMVKIVKKKTDIFVRDKVLVLLNSWQEAFGGPQGKYPQYFWSYVEVKGCGVRFPPRSGDTSPIFTPPITNPAPKRDHKHHRKSSSSVRLDEAIGLENGNSSSSEIEYMRGVMELLKDMLEAVNPHDCEALRDEVIIDLLKQCCSNQKKIRHLINSTRNEELLFQGLTLNDDLLNLIVYYNALATGQPAPPKDSESLPSHGNLSAEMHESTGQLEEEEDENDGFTQLARRNSNKIPHTFIDTLSTESDRKELPAHWTNTGGTTSVTSSSPSMSVPFITVGKEQDVATLLSTLSTDHPSHQSTPAANSLTLTSISSANSVGSHTMHSSGNPPENPLALSPILHSASNQSGINSAPYPCYSPQPHPMDQDYFYTGHIAPWAQQSLLETNYELQPEFPGLSSYPPPPWETSPGREDDHFLSVLETNDYGPVSSNALWPENSFDPREDESFHTPRPVTSTAADMPSIASHHHNSLLESQSSDRETSAQETLFTYDNRGQITDVGGALHRTTIG